MIDNISQSLIWTSGTVPLAWIILGLLTAQRAFELVYAGRNTRRLLADGAVEYGQRHYPFMVAIHSGFLLALWIKTAPSAPIIWPLAIAFVVLQAARFWVLATLGPYWTTRIISSPHFPRINNGPFRLTRHPNYVVVTLEIAIIPLIFGHSIIALAFSILNAIILSIRISTEEAVLQQRTGGSEQP